MAKLARPNRPTVDRRLQRGLAVVEFALVGLLTFIILFGAIELARLIYTWNALTDGTRRGARVAAVCPLNHPAIANVTIWRRPDGTDTGIGFPGLTTARVKVDYLTAAGAPNATLVNTAFVRVAITGYQLPLFIPLLDLTIAMPPFETTLPAESLGIVPGGDPACVSPA